VLVEAYFRDLSKSKLGLSKGVGVTVLEDTQLHGQRCCGIYHRDGPLNPSFFVQKPKAYSYVRHITTEVLTNMKTKTHNHTHKRQKHYV